MENASKALIIAGAILISILLISIGIILINSGRDVVETGTAGMSSQKIQTFNAQFTAYEGTRKGSEIKSLANTVIASNATDEEHQVTIYAETSENIISFNDLISSKNYTVKCHYNGQPFNNLAMPGKSLVSPFTQYSDISSENGYIDLIIID